MKKMIFYFFLFFHSNLMGQCALQDVGATGQQSQSPINHSCIDNGVSGGLTQNPFYIPDPLDSKDLEMKTIRLKFVILQQSTNNPQNFSAGMMHF